MVQMSISFKTSSKMTSIKHNNRDLTEKEFSEPQHRHIDRAKIDQNIYVKQENLKDCYEKLFGQALEEYNSKQKRSDRKIHDYYQHVKKSKTLDLQREFIVGVGSKADWDNFTKDLTEKHGEEVAEFVRKEAGKILAEYVDGFQRRHPNLYVYNAAVHLDEKGHPHAHFNVIPVATGYKRGLAMQPSFKKALENEGYLEKGRHQLKQFKDEETEILANMLKEFGFERKFVGTNDIKDMREYKQMVAQIEQEKQRQISDIAVERSNLLSEVVELEEGIKLLESKKIALEDKLEGIERQLDYYERTEDEKIEQIRNLDKEIATRSQMLSESSERAIEGLEREFDGIVQEMRESLPEASESALDVMLVKKLGYEGVDDLILRNNMLMSQVDAYRGFWSKLKEVFQGFTMMNAVSKIKQALGMMNEFREPGMTVQSVERLKKLRFEVGTRDVFKNKLEQEIAKAKDELDKNKASRYWDTSSKTKDYEGPSL